MQDKVNNIVKKAENYKLLFIIALVVILYFSVSIRLEPVPNLIDKTTGLYLPSALDPFYFLRASEHILDGGSLTDVDNMRYLGGSTYSSELLSKANVVLFQIASVFSDVDFRYINVISPVIYFLLSMIVFYFLMIRLTGSRYSSIISTAVLSFTPLFLQRTAAGFSDHEAIGILFLFISLYYIADFLYNRPDNITNRIRKYFLFPLAIALTLYSWGGVARLLLIIYPMFFFLINLKSILMNREYFIHINRDYKYLKEFMLTFISFNIIMFILSFNGLPFKNFFNGYVMSSTGILLQFMVAYSIIAFIVSKIPQIKDNMRAVWAFGSTVVIGLVGLIATGKLISILTFIKSPIPASRVGQTVAENQMVSLFQLQSQVGIYFFLIYIVGAILILYPFISKGINMYFKSKTDSLGSIGRHSMFYLTILIVSLYSLNSSIRLMFVNSIFLAMFVGIVVAKMLRSYYNSTEAVTKMLASSLLALVIITSMFSIYGSYTLSSLQAKQIGPSANPDWQDAMEWARSTPEDSLFIHWWDYGYWVQTLGERATVTDGGHVSTYWDHLIGRYLLTTPDERSAFEMFNTYGVDYFLVDPSDIGKYGAYSSIGDNEPDTDDRTSYIGQFIKDDRNTQESANMTTYIYHGQLVLDEDYIRNDYILPAFQSAVVQLQLTFNTMNSSFVSLIGIATDSRGIPVEVDFKYIHAGGIRYELDGDYEGIVRFIPNYDIATGQADAIGGALVLSPRVKNGFFARTYILDEYLDSEYLEVAYEGQRYGGADKFIFYQGRLLGPITIYKINDNPYGINPGYLNFRGNYSAFDTLYYPLEEDL